MDSPQLLQFQSAFIRGGRLGFASPQPSQSYWAEMTSWWKAIRVPDPGGLNVRMAIACHERDLMRQKTLTHSRAAVTNEAKFR